MVKGSKPDCFLIMWVMDVLWCNNRKLVSGFSCLAFGYVFVYFMALEGIIKQLFSHINVSTHGILSRVNENDWITVLKFCQKTSNLNFLAGKSIQYLYTFPSILPLCCLQQDLTFSTPVVAYHDEIASIHSQNWYSRWGRRFLFKVLRRVSHPEIQLGWVFIVTF